MHYRLSRRQLHWATAKRSARTTKVWHRTWNQYARVLEHLPRSNNAVEGWHNAFNNVVGFAHPTTTKLARKLQQEQHSMELLRRYDWNLEFNQDRRRRHICK